LFVQCSAACDGWPYSRERRTGTNGERREESRALNTIQKQRGEGGQGHRQRVQVYPGNIYPMLNQSIQG